MMGISARGAGEAIGAGDAMALEHIVNLSLLVDKMWRKKYDIWQVGMAFLPVRSLPIVKVLVQGVVVYSSQ
jgi:hypothetical protein